MTNATEKAEQDNKLEHDTDRDDYRKWEQTRKKKAAFQPMRSATVVEENWYERYLTLKLKVEDKLKLCPYEIKGELNRKGGVK